MTKETITPVEPEELLEKANSFYDRNKKIILGVGGAIVLIVGGFIGYKKFVYEPKNTASKEAIWKSEYYLLDREDYNQAINGDSLGRYRGFSEVASKYNGYQGGEIAQYGMGIAYLNMGQFQDAVNALKDVKFSDELLGAVAKGALGDAYIELGDFSQALKSYMAAVNHSKNNLTAPVYLMKAALAHELLGEFDKAAGLYERIKTDFPTAREANSIDRYIELANQKAGK
ncbi:MAG: tetratricopeptide repeat protein [Flavobacteriales bacterium]